MLWENLCLETLSGSFVQRGVAYGSLPRSREPPPARRLQIQSTLSYRRQPGHFTGTGSGVLAASAGDSKGIGAPGSWRSAS